MQRINFLGLCIVVDICFVLFCVIWDPLPFYIYEKLCLSKMLFLCGVRLLDAPI